ncbi:uncharacterized protein [Ptychodera flava]|uniref:uncharacterized protein isoform X3 n=1 Tax=Ptychodera flava TaxID=63121 RepID=UPI00396A048B
MDDKETCPSCNELYQKASKRRIVDVCGHGRCYSCLSVGDFCPLCQDINKMDDKETCPSCNELYQKASKRRIVDVCGHGRCYSCLSVGDFCPLCQALLTDAGLSSQVNEDSMKDNMVESGRHVACGSGLTEKETMTAASEQQTATNCRDVAVNSVPRESGHQHEMSHGEMQHAPITFKEGATHEQHGCLPEIKRSGDTELTNSVEGAAHEQHGSLPLEESGSGTEHTSPVEGDSHKDRKCTSDSEGGEEEDGLVQAETTGEVLVKKMKNGKKRRRKAARKSSNASNSEKRQISVKSDGVKNPDIVAADEQETKQESRKERDARKKANAREKAGNVTENQPLQRRMRKSDGEFSCDKCGRTFNRKCHFASHLKTHTRHNLQCHRCLTVCSDNVEYVKHGEE